MHHLVAFESLPCVGSHAGATFTLMRRNGTSRQFVPWLISWIPSCNLIPVLISWWAAPARPLLSNLTAVSLQMWRGAAILFSRAAQALPFQRRLTGLHEKVLFNENSSSIRCNTADETLPIVVPSFRENSKPVDVILLTTGILSPG